MTIFNWDDSYSVGLASIDYQHKRLVSMINRLDEAVSTGSDETALRTILKGLYEYTFYHFSTEEELMRAAGPVIGNHYRSHKAAHDAFTGKIRPLAENAPLDSTTLNSALLGYLVDWLAKHILGVDKEMARLMATIEIARDDEVSLDIDRLQAGANATERNLLGALHESELRFRSLADSAPMLIWIGDQSNNRVFFNKTWQNITGLNVQQLQQGAWQECLHQEDLAPYRQALAAALARHGELRHEFRIRRADGEYRWYLESAIPRPSRHGEFIGFIGSAMDITERKAAEQILLDARDRLEREVELRTAQLREANVRLEREKAEQLALNRKLQDTKDQLLQSEKMASIGQLAAGVAHEINNPIGYVKSNINSLQDYVKTLLQIIDQYEASTSGTSLPGIDQFKQRADYAFVRDDIITLLEESQEGVTRVKQIVQDLKDFSHIDQAEWKSADINRGLESTLNIAANEIKYKAEVIRDFGEIPAIECLPQQLNQVFMNLLVNAAQSIDERGTITVRTRPTTDGIAIEIADTGHGIPPEQLTRIFDPFFTTKPIGEGTGLGLSLAYGIINKHQGRIEVQSQVGHGTTFRITLPSRPPVDAPAATAPATSQ